MLKADLEASNSCSPRLAPRLWLVNILFSLPDWKLWSQILGPPGLVDHVFVDFCVDLKAVVGC